MQPSSARPGAPPPVARVAAGLLVLVAALLLPAAPAGAAAPADPPTRSGQTVGSRTVGGPALATDGVVQPPGTDPLPERITGASFVVADLDTGEVLAARDPHGRYGPASTIKTLTALALIPVLDPAATYTPTAEDVDLPLDSSRVGVVAGVAYPVRELFEGLLLMSGNDAANALAGAAGGQRRALELMAAEAERLQAHDTVARTVHGLDAEGQVSSAYDLALVARAAMQQPDFARYVATRTSSLTAPDGARFEIGSKNRLLWNYDGALGIKNGYTQAQRASFVGAAERDGRRLVVTVMRADPAVWKEVAALLDWGFAQPTSVRPVGELVEPLRPAAVAYGDPVPAASAPADGPDGATAPTPATGLVAAGEGALAPGGADAGDEGGAGWRTAGTGLLLLLGGVVGLRVRAVRLRRRRRARDARRPGGPRRPGAGAPAAPRRPGTGRDGRPAGRRTAAARTAPTAAPPAFRASAVRGAGPRPARVAVLPGPGSRPAPPAPPARSAPPVPPPDRVGRRPA